MELEEIKKVKAMEKAIKQFDGYYQWEQYKLPVKLFESSVFYYKHGLHKLKYPEYINGKAIIDGGCYIADSCLVFREFFPNSPLIGFEPVKSNCLLAKKTIALNQLENITIENMGLGEKNEILKIKTFDTNLKNIESTITQNGNETIKVTSIDDYVDNHNLKVGLIKTDVEGFEQQLLAGAKKTIFEQKPTLLISIYHSYDDFYKIKPMIESWNLGYRFDFFQGPQYSGDITVETMLICELVK